MQENQILLDIGIPIDLQKLGDTRLLIQAGSGGGKSYLIRKLAESVKNRVQQIIIDPEGEFVTLREKFDFALVSKEEGDIPLNLQYAETLAYKVLETGLSVIIDLYELHKDEKILFVKKFISALVNAPKELWHFCLIYIDEGHDFAPEGKASESTRAVIDLCSKGRKRGFGVIIATQRISKLSKDAASELLNKFIGRTGLDNDQKRAGDELGFTSKDDIRNLRNLEPMEFYGFGPAISNSVVKFNVKQVETTHLHSGNRLVSIPPTPNAIKKILSKLKDIPQEAEKELETKKQLTSEVLRLKKELTELKKKQKENVNSDQEEKIKELENNLKSANEELRSVISDLFKIEKEKEEFTESVRNIHNKMEILLGFTPTTIQLPQAKQGSQVNITNRTKAPIVVYPAGKKISTPFGEKQVKKTLPSPEKYTEPTPIPNGEKSILIACIQYPNGLERSQLTILTGYKRSTRDAYIARLKEKGFLEQNGSKILATNSGHRALGDRYQPLPKGKELQNYWLRNLPIGEKVILEILIKHYPSFVSRDNITIETGYQRSSRDAYISRMAAKEIIEQGRGEVKAVDFLFD